MRDQEIIGLWESYQQVCEAETARGPRLIDAYDKPPYSDDAAVAKNPVKMKRKGLKMKGVVSKEEVENVDEEKRPFPFKKVAAQAEKARKGSVYGKPATNEPAPNVSDKEKKETGRFSKMHQASEKAKREKQEADKSRRSSTFYKDTHPASAPKMKKANEEVETDLFDVILEHLVAEGYADTNEAALAIMANMSEEWREEIVEAKYGTKEGRHKLAMKRVKGEEIGKSGPGTGFKAVEKQAEKYGARDPKAVAAAAMYKMYGGKKG